MKKFILLFKYLLLINIVFAQPAIQWQRSMGGTLSDELHSISQTSDGGFICAGFAGSADGDVVGNHGLDDIWIVKFTPLGSTQWSKCIGGMSFDQASSIKQTTDGGYIISGISNSFTDDFLQTYGLGDSWMVKLDSLGLIEWRQHFGGTGVERNSNVIPTLDGGYLMYCETESNDIDASQNTYADATWLIKTNSIGQLEWQRFYGACKIASDVQATSDGCYIIVGRNCDLPDNRGMDDYWVTKIDSGGSNIWEKSFGGTNYDIAMAVRETSDRGYLVGGVTHSTDGDVTGNNGYDDSWVIKLDSGGSLLWQKAYGGSLIEYIESIDITSDGGFVFAGVATSSDGDVTGVHDASGDFWIVKADSSGNLEWENCYGGSITDGAYSIEQTSDGGFIIAGNSASSDGDVIGNHNNGDGWVLKLDNYTSVSSIEEADEIIIFPIPASTCLNIRFNESKAGQVKSAKIYNILNQEVLQNNFSKASATSNSVSVSVFELPQGIYTLLLETTSGTYTRKVMLAH